MQQELDELKRVRPLIAARIGEAKEQGDLSENAEYQAARDEQSLVETRILELEEQIKGATIIKHKQSDEIRIGSVAEVSFIVAGKKHQREFRIVGANEADPAAGMISNESPVAQALLGKRAGDVADVRTPGGAVSYTIIAIH